MSETKQVSIWRNFGPLIILVMGGSFIYSLPYFHYYYYEPFLAAFGINNTQMGNLHSAYGVLTICCYFIGGWLADRVSARKLISFSLISTGLLGLWLYTVPSYYITMLIHALWGITTILSFWPAMIKAVRMLAAANEQGKAFGFMESGRGIFNAAYMAAGLYFFNLINIRNSDETNISGMLAVIMTYSVACIVVGLITFFILKDNAREVSEKGATWADIAKVLKMPHTWMIIIIMFCSYSMLMSFYLINPFASQVYGVSVVFATALTIMANWVRPIGAASAGLLGDIMNSSKVIGIGFVMMIFGLLGLIFLPAGESAIVLLIIFSVFIYFSMYAIQGLHYALLEEGDYPVSMSGITVGVVATLGYLPEVVAPQISGRLLDAYPGADGYRYFFMVLVAFALVGLATVFVWLRTTKEKRAAILAMKKQNKAAEEQAA